MQTGIEAIPISCILTHHEISNSKYSRNAEIISIENQLTESGTQFIKQRVNIVPMKIVINLFNTFIWIMHDSKIKNLIFNTLYAYESKQKRTITMLNHNIVPVGYVNNW